MKTLVRALATVAYGAFAIVGTLVGTALMLAFLAFLFGVWRP